MAPSSSKHVRGTKATTVIVDDDNENNNNNAPTFAASMKTWTEAQEARVYYYACMFSF